MPTVTSKRYRRYGARPGSFRGGPVPAWLRWFIIVIFAATGVAAGRAILAELRDTDWAVAGPVWAAYVGGALVAGGLLALALHRWTRDFFRVYFFGGYLSLYLTWAFFVVPLIATTGVQLAESIQCHRTEGVVVQAHYVRTARDSGRYNVTDRSSWIGEYTVDGKTYDLVIQNDADVLLRQVGPTGSPPVGTKNPDVTRSYKVPWVGSSHACPQGTTSDFWRGFWVVVVGPLLGLGPILAGLAVRRRLRPTDESEGGARSLPA